MDSTGATVANMVAYLLDVQNIPIVFLKWGHSVFGKDLTSYWHYIHKYTNDFRQYVALGITPSIQTRYILKTDPGENGCMYKKSDSV